LERYLSTLHRRPVHLDVFVEPAFSCDAVILPSAAFDVFVAFSRAVLDIPCPNRPKVPRLAHRVGTEEYPGRQAHTQPWRRAAT